jgi:ribosome assembly protein 1
VDITEEAHNGDAEQFTYDFDNYLETGFQLATFRGPLCAEPVEGLAYFVESLDIDRELLDTEMCALV